MQVHLNQLHVHNRPKGKLVRITKNADFNPECHYLSNAPAEADRACFYDLDDVDDVWLKNLNGERALMGNVLMSNSNKISTESVSFKFGALCYIDRKK